MSTSSKLTEEDGSAATEAEPPIPTARTQLLLDDAHTQIELHAQGGEDKPLLITFDPLLYLWPKPAYGLDFLRQQGVDVITVRRKEENFYQPLSREQFMRVVAPVTATYHRVIAYGSSLGAYAALYYGRDLDCEVVAPSPRVSVHPVYGDKAWQDRVAFEHQRFDPAQLPRCRATLFYDPHEPLDRRFVEGDLHPQFPGAQLVKVPFSGHPCTQFLGDIGFIAPYMRALIAARPLPPLDRRGQRRRSSTYFQVLADLNARRGRLHLADSLVTRSLALRDTSLLAHRTRGLVKSLQRDWLQAVVSLERALAADPGDPLTRSMLERARRGLAQAENGFVGQAPVCLPVALSPTTPQARVPALWHGALRRLLGRR